MKVYEVISKETTTINELGVPAPVASAFGKLFKTGSKQVVRAAAKNRSGIAASAVKGANALTKSADAIGKLAGKATKLAGLAVDALLVFGFTAGAIRPLYRYFTTMSQAHDKLESGEWTKDNFDYVHQKEMSILIVSLGADLASTSILAGKMGLLKFFTKVPLLGTLVKPLYTLDKVASAAFLTWLATSGNKYLVGAALYDLTSIPVIGPILKFWGLEGTVDQVIGTAGVNISNVIKKQMGMQVDEPTKQSDAKTNTAVDSTSQPATTPATQPGDPTRSGSDPTMTAQGVGQWLDLPGDPTKEYNSVTGQRRYKN